MRRSPRHGVAAAALSVLLLALGACSAGPAPSPTSSEPPTAAPSTAAAATAQFNLFLREPASHTAAFRVVIQTDPATDGETEHTFCGLASTDPHPCDPSPYAFTIRVESLPPGTTVSYRFERVDTDGTVETLDQGSANVDQALVREVTYPEPVATP